MQIYLTNAFSQTKVMIAHYAHMAIVSIFLVGKYVRNQSSPSSGAHHHQPYLIVVEGLDGTGNYPPSSLFIALPNSLISLL